MPPVSGTLFRRPGSAPGVEDAPTTQTRPLRLPESSWSYVPCLEGPSAPMLDILGVPPCRHLVFGVA